MLMFSFLFSFARTKERRNKKENSPSDFFCLLRHFSPLNKKNSLTLKQLFVFNASKSTSASRQKNEAGPFRFLGRDSTSLCSLMYRHLVEEREEIFVLSREEEKIV